MFNSLRAAWHMPPLKYTPVTPKLTEAVTGMTLDLKQQTLEWLEIRKNETAPDGQFVFRPNIYDAKSRETLTVAANDPEKYTVFIRKIDLSDNGKVTTVVSRENADADTAFGMLAASELSSRMTTPDGASRIFPNTVNGVKPAPPGFGFLEVAKERGIVATAEASFRTKHLLPAGEGGPS